MVEAEMLDDDGVVDEMVAEASVLGRRVSAAAVDVLLAGLLAPVLELAVPEELGEARTGQQHQCSRSSDAGEPVHSAIHVHSYPRAGQLFTDSTTDADSQPTGAQCDRAAQASRSHRVSSPPLKFNGSSRQFNGSSRSEFQHPECTKAGNSEI